jgi:hypothetical protein
MEGPSYYLSKHTFFCLADNHYVFLDLREDEYLCLGRKHTDAIKGLLVHHAVDMRSAGIRLHNPRDLDASSAVQALLKKGLLVENDAHGKLPTPARVATPSSSIMEDFDNQQPRITPAHVWNFFSAAAIASAELRLGSIQRTVWKIAARKSTHATTVTAVDSGAISDLFQIFRTLRPYYPRKHLCLFDSLALLHFLSRYSEFPHWVYGVKLEPFYAHCWVQAGDVVVNDIVDNVRAYTPIMSV